MYMLRALVMPMLFAVAPVGCALAPPDSECDGECDGGEGEGEGADACGIDDAALALLVETVDQLFVNSAWAIANTHGGFAPDLAYGASLVGLDERVLQSATLVVPCTEPTTFEPTCETNLLPPGEPPSGFYEEHDRCFRLGCDGADRYFVDVYYVMRPNRAPEPRHEFTVALDELDGATSVYAENPYVRWNSDLSQADIVDVTADLNVTHVLTLANGAAVDLSHRGTVVGQHVLDRVVVDIGLAFPNITAGGATVEVHALPDGTLDGFVRAGVADADVASLTGTVNLDAPLPFARSVECE